MRTIRTFTLFSSVLLLLSCTSSPSDSGTATSSDAAASVSEVSSSDMPVTRNVTYTGIMRKLGASIYMQGTHKLELQDGRFILLDTANDTIDLDAYIDTNVTVHGSVQPTVEGGGTIMHVEDVTSVTPSSSSVSSSVATTTFCGGIAAIACPSGYSCVDNPDDSCDPEHGGADCGGICIETINTSSSSVASSAAEATVSSSSQPVVHSSSSAVSSVASASSVSSSANSNADKEQQIVLMAKQNYDAENLWTQKYCTSTAHFCIPVHKQWYYQSFGASAGTLWHVEFGMGEIDQPGQGVITLDLVSGSSAAAGGADGKAVTKGGTVIGYRDWDGGRHFELKGDARLSAAASYMLANMEHYGQ